MSLYALWTVAGTMVLFWLFAVCGIFTTGGWIHLLLIAAVLLMGGSLISRPRVV
jgi:hypothetical protein